MNEDENVSQSQSLQPAVVGVVEEKKSGKLRRSRRRKGYKKRRRTVLTPEKVKRIAAMIAKGVTQASACASQGVLERSWFYALRKDESIIQAVEAAKAVFQVAAVKRMTAKGWTGYAWILERRHPEWRLNQSNVQLNQQFVVQITDDEWKKEVVAKAQTGDD